MITRQSKKSVARKVKKRIAPKKSAPRKMKRAYDIHAGKPTGREVQVTPADARQRGAAS